MKTEISPEAPTSTAPAPALDSFLANELHRIAAKYRARPGCGHMNKGYVIIYCAGAVGWTCALSWPESWVPGCYAVPADASSIYRATGGTPANGAAKWETVS